MSAGRDGSFNRKVEEVLVSRLRDGQPAEELLAELKGRLGEDEAEAILARAESRLSPPAASSPALRVFAGTVYAWTAVLMLQNLTILMAALSGPPAGPVTSALVGFALLKIGLLCVGIVVFKRRRSALTAGLYALIVLYVFPLGLLVDPLLGAPPRGAPTTPLLSISALLSYASAGLFGWVWWLGRARGPPRSPAAAFD